MSIFTEVSKIFVWPIILAVSLFICFRKNLAGLIDRITIIKGPGGTELRTDEQKKAQEIEGKNNLKSENFQKISPEAKKQVESVKKDFKSKLEREKKNKEGEINYLLEQLSLKTTEIEFERIYRVIFGSQISLMRDLLSQSPRGRNGEFLAFYFLSAKKVWAPAFDNWSTDQYLAFLMNSDLIFYNAQQQIWQITDKGISFLQYIGNLNYPENKLN